MLSIDTITTFLSQQMPQYDGKLVIEAAGANASTIRHLVGDHELRPGGTVSGPVLMTVADVAMYVAILSTIGLVPLAVTTNLNINFLRKPDAGRDILGDCSLIKVGKVLVVGEVTLYSEGDQHPVAHAVSTYSIPPDAENKRLA